MTLRSRGIGTRLATGVALAALVVGCGQHHLPADKIDSSTNWLHACDSSSECGELACLCGVCNVTCGNDHACAGLDSNAECSASAHGATCDDVAASVCILRCSKDSECAAGLECRDGLCADPPATASATDDAGASVNGSDGGGDASALDYGFNFTQIAVGGRHACGLVNDGTTLCWGINTDGQLNEPAAATDLKQIAAGGYHTCGLHRDGSLVCWGGGTQEKGQVTGPNSDRRTGFTQIAAGDAHTCAIRDDGSLICWGNNNYGQVNGPNADGGHDFTQVTGGYEHTCAVRTGGTLICWGRDELYGDVSGPNGDGGADFVQVAAGAGHTCALRTSGRLVCWGTGEWVDEVSGPNADSHTNFVQVMTAAYQTCGLHDDGTIKCWGDDTDGQVSGPNAQRRVTDYIQLSGSIETDGNYLCGLHIDGTVNCWGTDTHEQVSGLDALAAKLAAPAR